MSSPAESFSSAAATAAAAVAPAATGAAAGAATDDVVASDAFRRRAPGYTRNRAGCLTCRHRKKKCDLVKPICGDCDRLNLVCRQEEPRLLQAGRRPRTSCISPTQTDFATAPSPQEDASADDVFLPASLSRSMAFLPDLFNHDAHNADLAASRRIMLRYYTSAFVFLLTTNLQNNCFLSVFLPMAFESTTLMKALVAWAAAHLATEQPSFHSIALRHRGSALGNLKVAVEEGSLTPEMTVATTMVLCSMESINEGVASWYAHLQGGVAALAGNPADHSNLAAADITTQLLHSSDGRWLIRNLAYHDALMSVSLDRRPLLPVERYDFLDEDVEIPDPYFGIGAPMIKWIARISHLKADIRGGLHHARSAEHRSGLESPGHHSTTSYSPSWVSSISYFEVELRRWQCPPAYQRRALGYLAEAYRLATLLHLYRTWRTLASERLESFAVRIRDTVTSTCRAIEHIPAGSMAECTLLFPLFMAGAEATDAESIAFIRTRISAMNQIRRFRNVTACVEILEEIWRQRACEVPVVDWLDVASRWQWQVALS